MITRFDWRRWQKENPLLFYAAIFMGGLLLFYLFVVTPLNYAVVTQQTRIDKQEKDLVWMSRAAQEIIRLKAESTTQREKTTESAFSLVNTRINDEGWKDLVTDVRQVEQDRVQVSFNSISFADLMKWLNKLFNRNGIFVLEATLQKAGPGKVQANLILQGPNAS